MKNNKLISVVAFFCVLIVYIIISLVIPFDKNNGFWTSFIFTIIVSFVSMFYLGWMSQRGAKKNAGLFFMTAIKQSAIYIIVQDMTSLILMLISIVPVWIHIIIYVIYFMVYAMTVFISCRVDSAIDESVTNTKEKIQLYSKWTLDIKIMKNKTSNDNLLGELNEILEILKYGDPVSNSQLSEVEEQISNEIACIKILIEDSKDDGAAAECQILKELLETRKEMCALYK